METGSLTGTYGVVTGASAGIGRAIAVKLASSGMVLALAARNESELHETLRLVRDVGGDGIVVPTDVTDRQAVSNLFQQTSVELGSPSLVVNNAGALNAIGPSWETDPDAWWRDVEVNLRGVYLVCREAVSWMKELQKGRIVNMTGGGAGGPFPFVSAYASSKAAVVRFSENLQLELNSEGLPLLVFSTSPGFVRTAMTEQFELRDEGRRWMDYMVRKFEAGVDVSPELAAQLMLAIAQGRLDAFAGRYLRAPDDVPRLEELCKKTTLLGAEERMLRIV